MPDTISPADEARYYAEELRTLGAAITYEYERIDLNALNDAILSFNLMLTDARKWAKSIGERDSFAFPDIEEMELPQPPDGDEEIAELEMLADDFEKQGAA